MSWQNKLESDLFSALFACANKAQSENHHHYPHNTTGGVWGHSSKRIAKLYEQLHLYPFKQLTSGKCHTSVTSSVSETKRFLLFFIQQKISRRCPWKTELFYTRYFSKRSANQQKQYYYWRMLFTSNKSVCQKLAQSCRKSTSAQKAIYALFAQKPSIIGH